MNVKDYRISELGRNLCKLSEKITKFYQKMLEFLAFKHFDGHPWYKYDKTSVADRDPDPFRRIRQFITTCM
jgi:hypothetical protein